MSFLTNEHGTTGRRRITQISNEEWRNALLQQIQEKQQRQKHSDIEEQWQENDNDHHNNTFGNPTKSVVNENRNNNDNTSYNSDMTMKQSDHPRMGRRSVQYMSNDEWREALEQQIREKKQREQQQKQQQDEADTFFPSERSQSAPHQMQTDLQSRERDQEPERASTTSSVVKNQSVTGAGARRRVVHQSREEYLKDLQDQMEQKKRLEQEAKAKRSKNHRDQDDDNEFPPGPVLNDTVAVKQLVENQHNEQTSLQMSNNQPEDVIDQPSSTQKAITSSTTPDPHPPLLPTADPTAIAKIVDFCEELKRQNEEVKKQLVEQHSVLASLTTSLQQANDKSETMLVPNSILKRAQAEVNRSVSMKSTAKNTKNSQKEEKLAADRVLPEARHIETVRLSQPIIRPRFSRGASKIPFPPNLRDASCTSTRREDEVGAAELKVPEKSPSQNEGAVNKEDKAEDAKQGRIDNASCGSEEMQEDQLVPPSKADWDEESSENQQAERRSSYSTKSVGVMEQTDLSDKAKDERHQEDDRKDVEMEEEKEVPLGADSKLVPCDQKEELVDDDEEEGELTHCTSAVVLDGPSTLLSLDRSPSDIFR